MALWNQRGVLKLWKHLIPILPLMCSCWQHMVFWMLLRFVSSSQVQLFPYSLAYLQSAVGGLGLNLTSADTLVFMEHDWNPMRDHQVTRITFFCVSWSSTSSLSGKSYLSMVQITLPFCFFENIWWVPWHYPSTFLQGRATSLII